MLPGDLYCCEPANLNLIPDLVQQAVEAQAAAVLLPEQAYGMASVRESGAVTFPSCLVADITPEGVI